MLKVKDNVDLKELEKFGFELSSMYGSDAYNKFLIDGDILSVFIDNRKLYLDAWETSEEYLLYVADDLIKADLIEKIDDK